jgi:hypothetical protein
VVRHHPTNPELQIQAVVQAVLAQIAVRQLLVRLAALVLLFLNTPTHSQLLLVVA